MAAPITHIVLADKVFNSHFSDKDKAKFFVGTSFPDIRYLGIIQREKTHLAVEDIEEIQKESSFMSGLKLHVYIDKIREEYISQKGIYDLVPKTRESITAIKLFEDQLLYDRIRDWETISTYFNDVLEEEVDFGLQKPDIQKWHTLLQNLFHIKPELESLSRFMKGLNIDHSQSEAIHKEVLKLNENEGVQKIIKNFYTEFPTLL
jgi:hypothetical protein